MSALLVALGAAAGAPARLWLDLAVQRRHPSPFPWGIFVVNVSGSFALGVVLGAVARHGVPAPAGVLLGTGFCGAFTTFSTFALQSVLLVEEGAPAAAWANVVGSVAGGLVAAGAGWLVAGTLW